MALRIRQKVSKGVWVKSVLLSVIFVFTAQYVSLQSARQVAALTPNDSIAIEDTTPPEVEFLTPNNNPQPNLRVDVKVTDDNLERVSFDVTRLNDDVSFSTKKIIVAEGQKTLDLSAYDLCEASIEHDTEPECNATWIQDGSYRIRAKAYGSSGPANISTTSKILVDTREPSVAASLEAQLTNNYVTEDTFAIEGRAEDVGSGLSKVIIVLKRSDGAMIESGNLTLKPEGGFKYTLSGVSDGVYDAYVSAYDRAGNSTVHPAMHFTVDTHDPIVRITSPAENQMVSGEINLKGSIEDANAVYYSYSLKDTKGEIKRSSGDIYENVIDRKIALSGLLSGRYVLILTATDSAGHSRSETVVFMIDHTPPQLTISGPREMKLDGTATFTIKSTEALNGLPSIFINGTEFHGLIEQIDTMSWKFRYTPPRVARYDVIVAGGDGYGNLSSDDYSGAALELNVIANPPTAHQTNDANLQLQNAATALAQPLIVNNPVESDKKDSKEPAVLGSETQADSSDIPVIAPSDKGWQILGVAWYWVLLMLAGITMIGWRVMTIYRRKRAHDSVI